MKKKIRILLALMGLEIGGAETHVVELARYLSENGFIVYVVSNGGVYEKELEKCGITHIYAPLTTKNPVKMFSAYKIIKKAVTDYKIDLIHAHARIPAFISSFVHKRLKVPFMTTVHGVYSTSFVFKALTNWGQKTICVSDDIQNYVIDNYNIDKSDTFVTINGIDTAKFSEKTPYDDILEEFNLEKDDFKIVYVSRLDFGNCEMAYKLINISDKLKKILPNAKIIMVGGGDRFDDLKEKAENCDNIIFAGRRTDVEKFTALSDVFVGISRAALEAMSAGNVVILGGKPGYMGIFKESILNECFANNFTCRNTKPLSEDRLLRDIIAVYDMTEVQKKPLIDFGKKLIYNKYSVKIMAEDNITVYKKLLSENNYSYDFVISGYYGFNNSGDDTLLMAMIKTLKMHDESLRILVLSKNPAQTKKLYNVDSVNRINIFKIASIFKKSKVLLSGGGSLVQDVTSTKSIWYYLSLIKYASSKNMNVYVYANGIGPIIKEKNMRLAKSALSKSDLITLRENDSKILLESIGIKDVKTIITADPAFTLECAKDDKISNILHSQDIECSNGRHDFADRLTKNKILGVSVRNWKKVSSDFADLLSQRIESICKKHGFVPFFVPMQFPADYEFSKRVLGKMSINGYILKKQHHGSEIMGLIKKCDVMMAMRLHALIYSTNVCVPVFGIVYDPKVESFLNYARQPFHIDVNSVSDDSFEENFDKMYSQYDKLKEELSDTVEILKEKSYKNSLYAMEILNKEEICDEDNEY